jgi:hypothetical protein
MSEVRDTDKGWTRLVEMSQRSDLVVRVGIQGTKGQAPHVDEDGDEDGGLTNVELGTIHEYGVPSAGIPERSFIRATIDAYATKYVQMVRGLGQSVIDGKRTVEQALGLLGARVRADAVSWIDDGRVTPDISDETKRRKGSSKPLLDTGQLKGSITYVVGRRRQ